MLPQEKTTIDTISNNENTFICVNGKYVFRKGELFDSYDDLLQRIEQHSKESLVYYWRRDSRTVERAFKKTSRPIASKLKYYLVRFACVYGGMKFQTRSAGRRTTQTIRTDCPSHIFLRASKCGEKLEVISVCNIHNHEISEKVSQMLPQNRRLPKELKEEVFELLRLKVGKKKIIEYVNERENKKITSKDLFNLASKLKANELPKEEGEKRIAILQNIFRSTSEKSIKTAITRELSLHKQYQEDYFPNDGQIDEYISPDHEFVVNETIIDSIIEARRKEISQMNVDGDNIEKLLPSKNENDFENENLKKEDLPDSDFSDDIIVDEREELDERSNELDRKLLVAYEDYMNQDTNYYYSNSTIDNNDSIPFPEDVADAVTECGKSSSNRSVILFETTTGEIGNSTTSENNLADLGKIVKEPDKVINKNPIITNVRKNRRQILKCRKCGSNAKLVKMQINYLRARRNKLLAETMVLNLKKEKLKKEINQLEKLFA